MCGIVGRLNFNKGNQVSEKIIREMTQTLGHRGPDDQGIFVNGNIGLGHVRLSIIDLSSGDHQPMSDNEKKIWITFDGKIYNFLDIKKELEKEGIQFRSRTDTEVIIYLYKKYGINCLKYLRGPFAFAIWDKEKRQLFLARDKVGKKPLKYYLDKNCFIFASELKTILKNPEVKKEPDFEAIHHFLTYQYVPSPWTGFINIKKLPPAHYMVVKESGEVEIKRYWKLNYSEKWNLSEEEWCKKIIEKLEESVKLRLISDVPLGAFLSGGIDSSAIVALMSKLSTKPVKTFSIGFETKENSKKISSIPFCSGDLFNELPYARKIAKLFKTDHHEMIVQPNIIEIMPQLAYFYEEPYGDTSALPSWYLAKMAKKYITVALCGDGGDENFGGYFRFNYHKICAIYERIPRIFRSFILKPGIKFLAATTKHPLLKKGARFVNSFNEPAEKYYLRYLSPYPEKDKYRLYQPFLYEKLNRIKSIEIMLKIFEESNVKDPIDRALYDNFANYLPDDLLVKMDIACMAHALEVRSPFLDQEFLETTAKMPANLKIKGFFEGKYILKKTLKNILPKEILYRPKQGFSPPISGWFRGPLEKYAKEILLGKEFLNRGLFRKEEVERLFYLNKTSQELDYSKRFWSLLFLEHWFRQYFD